MTLPAAAPSLTVSSGGAAYAGPITKSPSDVAGGLPEGIAVNFGAPGPSTVRVGGAGACAYTAPESRTETIVASSRMGSSSDWIAAHSTRRHMIRRPKSLTSECAAHRAAAAYRTLAYDHSVKRAAQRSAPLKKPTIRVVAAQAGVAVSTVSRYLNGDSVSAPTKAHLSRVIESLGYKPSRTARNLSLGLKGCIGVVVDSIQDPWFTQLLTGMEEELQARDISLMLLSLELKDTYDPTIAFEWIDERRVDGLIIAKCHRRDTALVNAALDAQLPIVAVAPDETLTDVAVLRADNVAAGRTLGSSEE